MSINCRRNVTLTLYKNTTFASEWQKEIVKIDAVFGARTYLNYPVGGVPCSINLNEVA